jgi:hypothetical protein
MSRSTAVGRVARFAVASIASLALATGAWAAQYPPGPGNCCPDTLTIINLQNPAAIPHPGPGDVVLGVGGIITGFHRHQAPFGFYMQMKNGLPYSGVSVFTGNLDQGPGTPINFQPGDSVVVYGKVQHFSDAALATVNANGETLVPTSTISAEIDLIVRLVSHGNPLPPAHDGTLAEFDRSAPTGTQWSSMLVRLPGPLTVVSSGNNKSFLVVNPACSGTGCDTVLVDCDNLTDIAPPPAGTTLSFVQGIFDLLKGSYRIQLRGPGDFGIGSPPSALDAFPIFDNDLAGGARRDSVMVVFDRPVEKTSAETAGNYALASLRTIGGAHRLDAPNDNRVVLEIQGARNDGDVESITVSGVKSLAEGTPMGAPQTLSFFNGVLALENVKTPAPASLAGDPCEDRSRYSGAGGASGLRASFIGTVTAAFGNDYTLQSTAFTRGGLWVHVASPALTPGHEYMIAGALQEVSGETQGAGVVYLRDLGAPLILTLPPVVQSVHVLRDEACDAGQLFLTGDDYDGMLVTMDRVLIAGSQPAGTSFLVATPNVPQEQIRVAALAGNFTFAAVQGRIVTVTGVLGRVSGAYAVFPRSNADIVDFGTLPTFSIPLNVSKAATASRDPDIVLGTNGELFMAWGRAFHESAHSLSLDNALNWSLAASIAHQGVQPALAVTPSNKFGVLTSGTEALFFKQSTDGGFQMDPPVTVVDGSATRYPALAVGSGEHLHAAWERTDSGIFYARSLTGGADFGAPFPIATNSLPLETNSMARICASNSDNLFVFWQYHLPGEPAVDRVMYRRSLDGGATFSPARRVRDEANPLTSVVRLAILADAQVGPDGTVYVMGLQQGGPPDSVAFLRSTNNGASFVLVGHPTAPAGSALCPKSFAVDPRNTIHALVGVCGTALYYTRSTDGGATWGPAVDVTSPGGSSEVGEPRGAKIILDASGKPVIVWFAPVGGSTEIHSARLLN